MSMNMVICDTGVSGNELNYITPIDIGFGIYDDNGHGSQLTKLIHLVSPKTNIYSIKILDKSREGTLADLIYALNVCKDLQCKVICLALSVDSSCKSNQELESVINTLNNNGIIIVSALFNGSTYSIPAGLKNVIGVRTVNYSLPYNFYDRNREIQSFLPIEPIISEAIENRFSLIGGNSLACALFATHILECYEKRNMFEKKELENYLEGESISNFEFMKFYKNEHYGKNNDKYHYINEIVVMANNIFKINMKEPIYNQLNNLEELTEFLTFFLDKNIFINKTTFLRISDLINVDSLTQYFMRQEKKF